MNNGQARRVIYPGSKRPSFGSGRFLWLLLLLLGIQQRCLHCIGASSRCDDVIH